LHQLVAGEVVRIHHLDGWGKPQKGHGMMRIRPVPYVVAVLLSTAAIAAFLIGWGWLAD
jgi:hypothetical protein